MTRKKSSTKAAAESEHPRDVSDSWGSYALTDEEAGRIGRLLSDHFEPDNDPALVLLALLKSFTYTRDHARRENMLGAVESALTPALIVAVSAVTEAVRERFLELTAEGGES
jgi:hypothetical protein